MRIDSLQALYDGYLKEAIQVEKNRKPGEGIFGIGKKPKPAHPCEGLQLLTCSTSRLPLPGM